jgi:hypothetical protein
MLTLPVQDATFEDLAQMRVPEPDPQQGPLFFAGNNILVKEKTVDAKWAFHDMYNRT